MQNPEQNLEALLRAILNGICRKTPEPVIHWFQDKFLFVIQVEGIDQGRIIGRNGIVYWALNTILSYAGLKALSNGVLVEVMEPRIKANTSKLPFRPNDKWDREIIEIMLAAILKHCLPDHSSVKTEMKYPDYAELEIDIQLPKALRDPYSLTDQSFAEAIEKVMHAAGRADGCSISTNIQWV